MSQITGDFANDISHVLTGIEQMLIQKNRAYGDSVTSAINVFSHLSNQEQLYCRIDDKLARIQRNAFKDDEDALLDLIGYLVILRLVKLRQER